MNRQTAFLSLLLAITPCHVVSQSSGSNGDNSTQNTSYFNWSQRNNNWPALNPGIRATVMLSPCPRGVDTSGNPVFGGPLGGYPIHISDGPSSESAYVTGGTCHSEAPSGTVVFTPYSSHSKGVYLIESATSGIQEAINDICGISTVYYQNGYCHIVVPHAGFGNGGHVRGLNVYETIYFHAHESMLEGYGAVLNCYSRGPCLQIGNLLDANQSLGNTVAGISFRAPVDRSSDPAYRGSQIVSTQRQNGIITVETATQNNFRTGDRVTVMFTDTVNYWGDVPSITVRTPTTFTYPRPETVDILSQEGPGLVALTYVGILDNGGSSHFVDLQNERIDEYGRFNHFFDFWDDENATIEHYNNNGTGLNTNPHWMGYAFYSGGASNLPNKKQQLAPVISVSDSTMTNMNCFHVVNSNGLYVRDTVCQNAIVEAQVSNLTGNYQAAYFQNLYSETVASANDPQSSPWGGLGVAGLLGGPTSAGAYIYRGNGGFSGSMSGTGSAPLFVWFIVAHDATQGTTSSPLPVLYASQTASGNVTVRWPRIASGRHVIKYDVLRAPFASGVGAGAGASISPNTSLCGGGLGAVCGAVALGISQCSGFVCSYVDNFTVPTATYTINNGTFAAAPDFWPGQAVLSNSPLFAESDFAAVGIAMNGMPSIYADYCSYGINTNGGYTSCFGTRLAGNNAAPNQPAMLLTDGSNTGVGGVRGAKGRLNFITNGSGDSAPHHVITLFDANPRKTVSTTGYRPVADSGDGWIGIDSQAQIAFGADSAISSYIHNIGDNSSWLERLTSTDKTIVVPISLPERNPPREGAPHTTMLYADSNSHKLEASYNKEPFYPISQTISSGSIPLGHPVIAPGSCAPAITISAAGLVSTDVIDWTLSGVASVSDGLVKYTPFVTEGHLQVEVCNPTTSSQTVSGVTLNWKVFR